MVARRGETRPIRRRPKATREPNSKDQRHWTPACAGRRIVPECRAETTATHAAGNGEAEPAVASPSAAPSAARGRRELSRRCLSPPGRVSTRPAGRGWSEGTAKPALRQGRFIHLSCRHKKDGRPAGARPGQSPPTDGTREPNSKDQAWTPACAGATNRVGCRAETRHHAAGNGEAEPAASAERKIVASMSARQGRVSTPAGRGEGTGKTGAAARSIFLVAEDGRARPETERPRTKQQGSRHACPGRMAKPSRQQASLLQRRAQPAAGGIVASMSEPARASFDATRRARVERGTGAGAAAGRFFIHLSCRHKKDGRPGGRDPPITADRRHPRTGGPRPAPGRRIVSGCRARDNRQRTPPAMAKPSRQQPSLLQRRAQPAAGGIVASMSGPPGRVSTRPAGRGWARAPAKPALRQGRFYPSFLSPQERWSPAGARPDQSADRRQPENQTARINTGPRPAPGRRIVSRMPRPRQRQRTPPAMAKPSRQWLSPSAAPSAARGRRELSRRCLSPPGRVSTRPAGRGGARAPAKPALRRGAFLSIFLVATRKMVARQGETRPTGADRRQPENQTAGSRHWTPACAGRRIVPECRARNEGLHAAGNGEAEPAATFPFCSAECSPRPAGIVASMSEPAGEFRRDPPAWAERAKPALRQGRFFIHLSCRHKRWSPPGRDPANHRQPKAPQNHTTKIKSPGPRPAPGRRITCRFPRLRLGHPEPPQGCHLSRPRRVQGSS